MAYAIPNNIAVIDDTPEDAFRLAVASKRIGGYEPTLYSSTSSFMHEHGYDITTALARFKAIICDNNFQTTDGAWGHEFLINTVGPALFQIPEEQRPLVICFAPSSWEVIREHKEALQNIGILSLHKQDQIAYIGLALRISSEGIIRPSLADIDAIVSVTTTEGHPNLFFANEIAPQIYNDFMDATSFDTARTMLTGITPCSLDEIRNAALGNLGPQATEMLQRYLPGEGPLQAIEF